MQTHPIADRFAEIMALAGRLPMATIPHWRDMRRFMRDPEASLRRLLD